MVLKSFCNMNTYMAMKGFFVRTYLYKVCVQCEIDLCRNFCSERIGGCRGELIQIDKFVWCLSYIPNKRQIISFNGMTLSSVKDLFCLPINDNK